MCRIEQLSAALCCKERLIQELTEERTDLRQRVRHMEEQLQQLSASLLQKERDAQVCLRTHALKTIRLYLHRSITFELKQCMLGRNRRHLVVTYAIKVLLE